MYWFKLLSHHLLNNFFIEKFPAFQEIKSKREKKKRLIIWDGTFASKKKTLFRDRFVRPESNIRTIGHSFPNLEQTLPVITHIWTIARMQKEKSHHLLINVFFGEVSCFSRIQEPKEKRKHIIYVRVTSMHYNKFKFLGQIFLGRQKTILKSAI